MRTDTLFQICMYFTMCLLVFSLSVTFVVRSGFYGSGDGVDLDTNYNLSQDANTTISNVTQQNLDEDAPDSFVFTNLWSIVITGSAGGLLAAIAAWAYKDVRIIGVYLFGLVFWAAYINMFSIITIYSGFFPPALLGLVHAASIFMFMGTIIGIFTGSG